MGVSDIFFKKDIKIAFSRVKEHILSLERELRANKEEILNLRRMIESLKNKQDFRIEEQKFQVEEKKPPNPQNQGIEEVSSGNQGVHSFIHSFTHSFNTYAHDLQKLEQDFDKIFGSLSHQEFLTFLTIYQLEEEIKQVTYIDVAKKLNLTEGCIRTYISSLLKKELPLMKKKQNNKQVFLYILPEFRSLNLKQRLIDTFYRVNHKKTLREYF